ncbi:kinase-like domain-containing protein [Trametes polyzona]|nr:kinase-like domain-containing protein [Trametes polyzona]
MSAQSLSRKRPVLTDSAIIEHYAKATREGVFNLTQKELFWQARQSFLTDRGYHLRPRYSPGWRPSWANTNHDPMYCEDSIPLLHSQVIDATRVSDHTTVAIKKVSKKTQELPVARFLASITDPRNHTVTIHEVLSDPFDPQLALLVMPFLRPCNNPEFATIGDVIDFIDQTIEGLVFMHEHNVAHRDIAVQNVMMDARALYPHGHHPVHLSQSLDVQSRVSPLPRAGRNIRYFYIDFGWSSRFSPGSSTLVIGDVGRAYVPELSGSVPYDAFKVDIYALGNLYSREFEKKYTNTEFLHPLIESMTQTKPELRPTAHQVFREWEGIRTTLNDSLFRWRLVPRNEPPLDRVVNDTVAVAWEGVYRLKKFVAP